MALKITDLYTKLNMFDTKENSLKKFKKIYIEITNVCNLSCDFCPKTERNQKFMKLEEFEQIIEKLKNRTEQVYLHVLGEPLLHPYLREILDVCEKNFIRANITTNGVMIKERTDVLVSSKSIRIINISLHSFEKNIVNISMEQYIDDILHFTRKIQQDGNATVKLRLWNLDGFNGDNIQNTRILEQIEDFYEFNFKIEHELTEIKGIKLARQVYLSLANRFKWPSLTANEYIGEAFCYGLRDHIAILVDGTVVPCCLDAQGNIPLGNILCEDIEDILNSKRAKSIYDGFTGRTANEELCIKCDYRRRFAIK